MSAREKSCLDLLLQANWSRPAPRRARPRSLNQQRLVVVSNRLAEPGKVAAGGLAVALGEALAASGGLWFGSSGHVAEDGAAGEGKLRLHRSGNVTLAAIDLSREDHDTYYRGYANGALWPALHYRLDLADFDDRYIEGYRRVNRMFARALPFAISPLSPRWAPSSGGKRP